MKSDDAIMRLLLEDVTELEECSSQVMELIFILDGEAEVTYNDMKMILRSEEYFFCDKGKMFSLKMRKNGLFCRIQMNERMMNQYVDLFEYEFRCNSSIDKHEVRVRIQRLLRQIINYSGSQDPYANVMMTSFYYQLLYVLSKDNLVRKKGSDRRLYNEDEVRLERIMNYIQNNYNSQITLSDLSEQTFFSPTYLSKYIKKKTGKNFFEVISDIRMGHALEELSQSGNTIMKTALNSGFPNTAAFNKAFLKKYGITPSVFQTKMREENNHSEQTEPEEERIRLKIKGYIARQEREDENDLIPIQKLNVRIADARVYQPCWNKMINGGLAKDLLRADMQAHLKKLKEELQITYVRFWDIYAPEMMLSRNMEEGIYNFIHLDMVLDFLCSNGLKPYIELGFKPLRLMRNVENFMLSEEREKIFRTNSIFADFLSQLLKHCVNRYGIEEVESWYFEQWKDPKQIDLTEYFEMFETAYHQIKKYSSKIKVGGAGLNRDEGNLFRDIICAWSKRDCYPDFISLYSYPYESDTMEKLKNEYNVVKSRNAQYMKDYVDAAKKILREYGFNNQELHISEWNFTISNRNCLNDSAFKGAYVVKNLFDNLEKTDLVGYWFGSDLFSEYYDTSKILDGSGGLLSKDGICKPVFHGFSLMGRLGSYLLGREENVVITSNLRDSYSIICHNYKHPNYMYFQKQEHEIRIMEQKEYFDDEQIRIKMMINGVKNGTYMVKSRTVSAECGSVQDEWLRMGLSSNLNLSDIQYLQNICVPRISIVSREVSDNKLMLDLVLDANEIRHIHISYHMT